VAGAYVVLIKGATMTEHEIDSYTKLAHRMRQAGDIDGAVYLLEWLQEMLTKEKE